MFYYIFSIVTSYFDKLLVFYETLAYIVVPILYFAFVLLTPYNFNTRIYLVHIAIYYEAPSINLIGSMAIEEVKFLVSYNTTVQ
jgi:hypothetical protein